MAAQKFSEPRRGDVVNPVKRRVTAQNPLAELNGVSPEICGDVSYVVMLHGSPFLSALLRVDGHITFILG